MFASDGGGLGAVWKLGDEFYLAKQVHTLWVMFELANAHVCEILWKPARIVFSSIYSELLKH
jgi:hypothetical protein